MLPGPPQADKKEVKKIGRIGENVKIVCPIGGYPAPIIEWSKNGEKIDYMWDRHRTGKKSLKIKHVNADDTGIFTCKGKKKSHDGFLDIEGIDFIGIFREYV